MNNFNKNDEALIINPITFLTTNRTDEPKPITLPKDTIIIFDKIVSSCKSCNKSDGGYYFIHNNKPLLPFLINNDINETSNVIRNSTVNLTLKPHYHTFISLLDTINKDYLSQLNHPTISYDHNFYSIAFSYPLSDSPTNESTLLTSLSNLTTLLDNFSQVKHKTSFSIKRNPNLTLTIITFLNFL